MRDFTAWLRSWSGELFSKTQTNIGWSRLNRCKTIEISKKNARFKSWNLTGKLKGYLFHETKLWEELVVLTAKVKKPRSQKKKQEVIKKMVYCVKMSILESFLYNFLIIINVFLLCVPVVWSLNCSVLSSISNSVQLRARFCTLAQLLTKIM